MVKKVIKKGGKLEIFKQTKIIRNCKKCGIPEPIAKTIANIVAKKTGEKTKTSRIRKIILELLDRCGKGAKNWRAYEKKKKKK